MKYLSKLFTMLSLLFLLFVASAAQTSASSIEATTFRSFSNQERQAVLALAQEHLGQEKLTLEVISSINEDNRFVLVTGQKQGYLVYDRFLGEYLEYSKDDVSPFAGVNGKKIYLSPGNYFYESKGLIINAEFGNVLTAKNRSDVVAFDKQLKQDLKDAKEAAKGKAVLSSAFIADDFMNYDSFDGSLEASVQTTTMSTFTEVPYAFYFENLRQNMGSNSGAIYPGSCGFVTVGMMLSYYDTTYNDSVIGEGFDVPSFKTFTSFSQIKPEAYWQSPGIGLSFQTHLIQMAIAKGYTNNHTISMSNAVLLAQDYAQSRNLTATTHRTNVFGYLFGTNPQFVRNAISNGFPVYIHMYGTDPAYHDGNINHAVVGYRFNSTGIYVNFGWKGEFTSANISNYLIRDAFYINFSMPQTHSNNYLWAWGSMTGYVTASGQIHIDGNDPIFMMSTTTTTTKSGSVS